MRFSIDCDVVRLSSGLGEGVDEVVLLRDDDAVCDGVPLPIDGVPLAIDNESDDTDRVRLSESVGLLVIVSEEVGEREREAER